MPPTFPEGRLRAAGLSTAKIAALRTRHDAGTPAEQQTLRGVLASATDETLREVFDPGGAPDPGVTPAAVEAALPARLGPGRTVGTLGRFVRKLAESPSTAKVVIVGDSTAEETNYPQTYTRLRTFHTTSGQAFAGMTPANIVEGGNSGLSLQAWLAGTNGEFRPSHLDALTDVALVVLRFGTNDLRLGARTQAQLAADYRAAIDLVAQLQPDADVVVATPPTFTTTVVGQDFLGGATRAQAQARSEAMRNAVLSLRNLHPHVLILDAQADLWGTVVGATSPLMGDQLHPNQAGQERFADYLARQVAAFARSSGLAPAGSRFETDRLYVWAAGNGYLDVGKWTNATGPEGRELPLTVGDTLYSSDATLAPVPLTGATFAPSGNSTRILKAGDWTAYANRAAVIIGDHPAEGVRGGRTVVTVDPGAVAPASTLDVTVTVTGARTGMGVIAQPPALTAGLVWAARVSGTDQVTVRLSNLTGTAIDEPSGSWLFWLAR